MEKGNKQCGNAKSPLLTIIALLVTLVVPGFKAMSAELPSDLPQITNYYPGQREDNPMELKPTTKAYAYFASGSAVAYCKAAIVQDDQQIGTCIYRSTKGETNNTVLMDPTLTENQDIVNIPAGKFTLKFYEMRYVADGVDKTHSDIDNPFAQITYQRNQPDGKLLSAVGLDDRIIKSYYEPASEQGVRVYTFDRPVLNDNISAYFEYGMGTSYTTTNIPHSLSEDGTKLTIDLRGKCYNVDALAPGVVFRDDNGDPCPPPTVISVCISGLNCVDGTRIMTYYVNLEGETSHLLTGMIYENFNYEDLTFDTPRLTKVVFYDNANPSTYYGSINDQTDMMQLTVSALSVIDRADIRLSTPQASETIDWADISHTDKNLTAALPESIKDAGSDNLTISLINVEYRVNDGLRHEIAPLSLSELPADIIKIAQLKLLAPGTNTVLKCNDGITVTLSNEAGYTFAEDETGGLQIMTPDYKMVLRQGKKVTGELDGTYVGNGIFMLNEAKSDYTETDADVATGIIVNDASAIDGGDLDNCLITIQATEAIDIAYDQSAGYIVINSRIPVITDFVEGLQIPTEIDNITGVLYNDPNMGEHMLIMRSMADFNQRLDAETIINSIAEIQGLEANTDFVLNLDSAKVTYTNDNYDISVIEDATGAVIIYNNGMIIESGKAYTGTIKAQRIDEYMIMILPDAMDVTKEEVDVTKGAEITIAEAHDSANIYRLVTFDNTDEQPIVSETSGLNINDEIYCVDYFGVLDGEYFPANVESFTGLILPPLNTMGDLDDDDVRDIVLIAIRSLSDVVAKTVGIESIKGDTDTEADIYDLRGVKVGKVLKGGIYIINGKKVLR